MATLVKSFSISGSEAYPVDIEVKTMDGMLEVLFHGSTNHADACQPMERNA